MTYDEALAQLVESNRLMVDLMGRLTATVERVVA